MHACSGSIDLYKKTRSLVRQGESLKAAHICDRGDMNFWTAMEILGGLVALAGIIIALIEFVKKT